jgi:serine/threonine protein kinase
MSDDNWTRIQSLFDALCDLPPDERARQLAAADVSDAVRAEVQALLDHDNADGLDRVAEQVGTVASRIDDAATSGTEIGPWRLLRKLGAGGMGDVYLAERADGRFEARAAFKFVTQSGERAASLFERERRILARLDHPAIARIFDAGEHDRLGAYLVMEYIDGRPLNEHAEIERLEPLAIVEWILRVTDALAHAHGQLILHRDLKPAHLLVTADDQLKVLDFGIASLLESDQQDGTTTAHGSYTPRYASPEQILHRATSTRTDLFAVGLLLHELLTGGASPFGDDPEQWSARKLAGRRDPLPPLAGLDRRRIQDLNAILDRCRASPDGPAYSSASELENDLRAVLDGRPVRVRRVGALESIQRWVGRHRLASAAMLIAISAILVGSGVSLWFARQAQSERDIAILEAEKARQITTFLEEVFTTATPGLGQGPDTPVRALLDEGAERIQRDLRDQDEIAAYLELAIARSYMFLGMYDEAGELLTRPPPDPLPDDPATWVQRRLVQARIDLLSGRYEAALVRLDSIADWPMDPAAKIQRQLRRAEALVNLDRPDEAGAAAEAILPLADDSEEGLMQRESAYNMLGILAYNAGDLAEAQARFSEMLAVQQERLGEMNERTTMSLYNLGGVSLAMGDVESAIDYYERSTRNFEAMFGVENRTVAMSHRALGIAHQRSGNAEEAEHHLRRAMNAYEAWNGRAHPSWQEAGLKLVELLLLIERSDEASSVLGQLPGEAIDELSSHQQVACRTQRLQMLLGLIDPPADDCRQGRTLPAFSRALEHLVSARLAAPMSPAFENERTAGRSAIGELSVSEPLLHAAFDALDP